MRIRATFVVIPFLLLTSVLFLGNIEYGVSRLAAVGEWLWPGYMFVADDPVQPECDPAQIQNELTAARSLPAPQMKAGGELPESEWDELQPESPPVGTPEPPPEEEWDELQPESATEGEGGAETDGVPNQNPPHSVPPAADSGPSTVALEAFLEQCRGEWSQYHQLTALITPSVRMYRSVDRFFVSLTTTGREWFRHALVILVLLTAVVATLTRHHIALRPPKSRLDYRVSSGVSLVANGMLAYSFFAMWQLDNVSGIEIQHSELPLMWCGGFVAMAIANLREWVVPEADAPPGGTWSRALLSVPLYAGMALISGGYYFLFADNPTGLASRIGILANYAQLYFAVGLYVWAGMLLKSTRVSQLVFDLVRPWKLSPELLAVVIVVAASLPTAYTGASGIFVIAAGGMIYRELIRAGARPELAAASTAMSGSLGVVLSPCLLVVIIAALNNQVTTDQLFGWGKWVFVLTSVTFLAFMVVIGRHHLTMASPKEAFGPMMRNVWPLVPYAVCIALLLGIYAWGLDVMVTPFSAPLIVPTILLCLLFLDRRWAKKEPVQVPSLQDTDVPTGFLRAGAYATAEATNHIGALLTLMALSICLGSVVEESNVMAFVPAELGSPWMVMAVLTLTMVLVGMFMDPYGAVVLVSASIAQVAYNNGINATHFWMMVLVAFEFGYLTPPVALNHLLTRHVIHETDAPSWPPGTPWWTRHERVALPLAIVGVALLVVAFGPLLFGS
ncbi:MAG: TRAP transporter large permease subunit [Myxococcales bacterium]|nr:TRAP transporter large permease subunit [Myxococcales bacterium]